MKIIHRKNGIASALSLVIGSFGAGTITADTIVSWDLQDFDNDSLNSDFAFFGAPPGNGPNQFGATGETGCINALDGNTCDPIAFDSGPIGLNIFSTGFNFGGTGLFVPNITADLTSTTGSASGQINIDKAGTLTLSFSALDFGGRFPYASPASPGGQFILKPDVVSPNGTGLQGSGPFIEQLTNLGGGDIGATVRYVGTIQESGAFFNFPANWRLEGVMNVQDAAPLVFINGNPVPGDATTNVAPNTTYVDQGAVCQDVVDGQITGGSFTTTINNPTAPNTGPSGSQFTVDYQCTDSQTNVTTATRTVNAGAEVTPPVITRGVDPDISLDGNGRNDTADGATVYILVGVTYVDYAATCNDNRDGDIPFPNTTPPFFVTPNPAVVDTSVPGATVITFSCNDLANNGPTLADRTVNVLADNAAPVISLGGANPSTIILGSTYNEPSNSTCIDTNPVDTAPEDITANLVITPSTVDTSAEGSVILTYTCNDAAGNPALQMTRTVNIAAGQNFRILSMTISDVDADGIAGCFRFRSPHNATCDLANRFSSDGSAATGFTDFSNITIPGTGTDLDGSGNPLGVQFWDRDPATRDATYQPITQFLDPGFGGVRQPISRISPGFNFTGFPFVPMTFNPPSEDVDPPSGFVTVVGIENILTIESLPFSGLYDSAAPNIFFLDPDEGTLTATILQDNADSDGTTRTFNYFMEWSHLITATEDPTGAIVNFTAFIRLEGVMTVSSVAVGVSNDPPDINALTAVQASRGSVTRIVTGSGGTVTAMVSASDPNGDNLSYDWSGSDSRLTSIGSTTNSSFQFNPDSLAPGIYKLKVGVTDDASNSRTSSAELVLDVRASAPGLSDANDSNDNGVSDAVEGFGDADNDGIADYEDFVDGNIESTRNRRAARADAGDIVSSSGRVRLGRTAFETRSGSFIVSEADVGVIDRVNLVRGIGHSGGGIYDFIISYLPVGGVVQVVLPQSVDLPVQPVYRKFRVASGAWGDFVTSGQNALASTRRVNNVCPDPDDPAYDDSVGLIVGDDCVRLTIQDGGPNDGDGVANGVVVDPGSVSGDGPAPAQSSQDQSSDTGFGGGGCSISVDNAAGTISRADWWLIGLFLGVMSLLRRQRRPTYGDRFR